MHLSEMALRGLGFQPADVMNLVQDFVNKENNRPGSTKCNPWKKVYLALGKKTMVPNSQGKYTENPDTPITKRKHTSCANPVLL